MCINNNHLRISLESYLMPKLLAFNFYDELRAV